MASALDMLPADTRAMVDAGDPRLRDDLLGIAAAEAAAVEQRQQAAGSP